MADMPWGVPSRSVQGRKTEQKVMKRRGGRAHPNSGAGKIKWDGSTEDELIEIKDANLSHTLSAKYLWKLFTDAAKQSKEAVYIVRFQGEPLIVECRVRRFDPTKDG